jgi:hypothetical protein
MWQENRSVVMIYLCHVDIRTRKYSDDSENTRIRPIGVIILYFKIFFPDSCLSSTMGS